MNECVTESPCHTNATCNDTEGSYTCTCDIGYSGDGFSCDGTNGIRIVIIIAALMTRNQIIIKNSKLRTNFVLDVNECVTEPPCHINATCNNTEGSYTCTCDAGYSGDGFSCDGTSGIQLAIVIAIVITRKQIIMKNSKLHTNLF